MTLKGLMPSTEDKDVISAGMGKELVGRWYGAFGKDYEIAESRYR